MSIDFLLFSFENLDRPGDDPELTGGRTNPQNLKHTLPAVVRYRTWCYIQEFSQGLQSYFERPCNVGGEYTPLIPYFTTTKLTVPFSHLLKVLNQLLPHFGSFLSFRWNHPLHPSRHSLLASRTRKLNPRLSATCIQLPLSVEIV